MGLFYHLLGLNKTANGAKNQKRQEKKAIRSDVTGNELAIKNGNER